MLARVLPAAVHPSQSLISQGVPTCLRKHRLCLHRLQRLAVVNPMTNLVVLVSAGEMTAHDRRAANGWWKAWYFASQDVVYRRLHRH